MQIPDEEVYNLKETFYWISSTLEFLKIDKEYPTNLIKKISDNFYDYLSNLYKDLPLS